MSELDLHMVKLVLSDYHNRGSFEMPELISDEQKQLFRGIVEKIPQPLFRNFSVQLITFISQEAELLSPHDQALSDRKDKVQAQLEFDLFKGLIETKEVSLEEAGVVILSARRLAASALGRKLK